MFTVHGGEKVTWPETSVRAGALRLVREERAHTTVRDLDDHLDDA